VKVKDHVGELGRGTQTTRLVPAASFARFAATQFCLTTLYPTRKYALLAHTSHDESNEFCNSNGRATARSHADYSIHYYSSDPASLLTPVPKF
jgi:hypothetical protein